MLFSTVVVRIVDALKYRLRMMSPVYLCERYGI